MKALPAYLLIATGILACFGLGVSGIAQATPRAAPGATSGPVLVVAPPWSGGPEAVVAAAGGTVVGLRQAPLAVLASGATSEAFRSSGAWFLLTPGALDYFCVTKD